MGFKTLLFISLLVLSSACGHSHYHSIAWRSESISILSDGRYCYQDSGTSQWWYYVVFEDTDSPPSFPSDGRILGNSLPTSGKWSSSGDAPEKDRVVGEVMLLVAMTDEKQPVSQEEAWQIIFDNATEGKGIADLDLSGDHGGFK